MCPPPPLSLTLSVYFFIAGVHLETGADVVCSILDIDLTECCLILGTNPNVLSLPGPTAAVSVDAKEKRRKRKSKSAAVLEEAGLSPGASVVGLVEHKTSYFLVLSCSTLNGCRLAYGLVNSVSQNRAGSLLGPKEIMGGGGQQASCISSKPGHLFQTRLVLAFVKIWLHSGKDVQGGRA